LNYNVRDGEREEKESQYTVAPLNGGQFVADMTAAILLCLWTIKYSEILSRILSRKVLSLMHYKICFEITLPRCHLKNIYLLVCPGCSHGLPYVFYIFINDATG